ncbi:MAG: Maf family protein [Acidimicrobiia bacterium]
MNLVLASSSERRRELLHRLGLLFEVVPADVDESRHPSEPPAAYVERLARAKAAWVAGPERLVIGADTTVVHDGHVLGKPGHPEEARSMLRRLQGERHDVFTGIAVASWDGGVRVESMVDVTEVSMVPMTDDEIADYVDSGEPMDKAGGYALQGVGGLYVDSIRGSAFTVIGLPIHLLPRLIARGGHELSTFRIGPDVG